jgi:ABC-type polysaccharide/polyol phosphate export permease
MDHLTIYRPNERANQSLYGSLKALLVQTWLWREHIWTNFTRDFFAPFQRAGLGSLWAIILPLTPVGAYSFLLIALRPSSETSVHPALIVTYGVTYWFFLSDCITSTISTIQNKSKSVSKTPFPLFGLVLSNLAQYFFEFFIRVMGCIIIEFMISGTPPASIFIMPFLIVLSIPLFLGFGLILGVFNAVNNDVGMITTVCARYGLFLSGAIFPLGTIASPEITFWLNTLNPFAFYIETLRTLSIGAPLSLIDHWILTLGIYTSLGILTFTLGTRLFYVAEYELRGDA